MKKQWMRAIICILFCAVTVMLYPVQAKAASQSDRDAYRAVFDVSYYYNMNPDVAAACGMDEEALFNHFVTYGVYEGRSASAEFNPQAYRQRYTDLQESFGNDMAAYCRHYVTYGRAEGRSAGADGQVVTSSNYVTVQPQTTAVTETTIGEEQPQEAETVTGEEQSQPEVLIGEKARQVAQAFDRTAGKVEAGARQVAVNATKKLGQREELTDCAQKQSAGCIRQTEEQASVIGSDIEMVGTAPEGEETLGRQIIGTYTTTYEDNVSRAINVELAAQRINGVVVQPGGSFSFSDTILERTEANGYAEGPVYVKGEEVVGIGGGVCQVSSTLYAAMVEAELPATERYAHSMPVDYVPRELEATIAGDYLDLKFDNVFTQPLLIQASAEGGTLTVTLVLE